MPVQPIGGDAMSQPKTKNGANSKVGLMSRICYGSPGCRLGLVKAGRERLEEEGTHFDVLAGGLLSGPDMKKRIKRELADEKKKFVIADRKAREAEKRLHGPGSKSKRKDARAEAPKRPLPERSRFDAKKAEEKILDEIAKELADFIPKRVFPGTQKPVRLYIIVSPLASYDGEYGPVIAEKLTEIRNDIRFLVNPDEHLPLVPAPHPDFQSLACLVPVTSTFKNKYDSAPVDYVLQDYLNRASKITASVVVVGCFGSHIYIPKGERNSQAIISVPNLHKTQYKKSTAENQVGVVVLEFTTDGELFVTNHNCNSGVLNERSSIAISEKYSETERTLLELFRDKEQSWWTSGLMWERLALNAGGKSPIAQDEIEKTMQRIVKKSDEMHLKPPISYDGARSGRYYIDSRWLEKNLRYPWPEAPLQTDRIVFFACLHALSKKTDHKFFVNETARVMLKHNANILIGAGDFIEGREHGLPEQGAVIAGADYTQQEKFAAVCVAEPMLRVFEHRFDKALPYGKTVTSEDVAALILSSLVFFGYRPGNHCEWTQRHGVNPLEKFNDTLVKCLTEKIAEHIAKKKLPLPPNLGELVESRIFRRNEMELPSGLTLRLDHLHMGGSETKTLNNQRLLRSRKAQVIIHGNFHVFSCQDRFEPKIGQRAVCEAGTLKRNHPEDSDFESNKGKVVDPGLGFVEVTSKNKGIVRTRRAQFAPTEPFIPFDNEEYLRKHARDVGCRDFACFRANTNTKMK